MVISSESTTQIKPGYTRVTKITGLLNDFSGIDPKVLQAKADLGSEVHKGIECYLNNDFIILSALASDYMDSFHMFKVSPEFEGFTVEANENRYYSEKHKITGCVDVVGKFKDEKVLIDWKTSASPSLKVWSLQMAFYAMLISENLGEEVAEAWIVQLKKGGSYTLHTIDLRKGDLHNTALDLLHVYRHLNPFPQCETP